MDDGSLLSHLPAEPKDLTASLDRKPGDANPGFNIEGLAWAPKADLLLGLRSPLIDNKAIVLRLPNAATWITKPSTPMKLSVEQELDLGGRGIRGMCYDEKQKGYWLIAGMAADPEDGTSTKPNDWSLYFWDGKSTIKKVWDRAQDPVTKALDAPEAICLVPRGDGRALLLISDDGHEHPSSSYVIIPEEQLGAH
jgi:hypothetical protein